MSYCRFSSMNWRCDVYVYEDVSGGWTTHVAGRKRLIRPIPDLPYERFPLFGGKVNDRTLKFDYPTRWHALAARIVWGFAQWWHNYIHIASLHLIPLVPIGLSHDGKSFNDPTPGACADTLEELRREGYVVPQYAIDELRREEEE